MRAPTWPAAIDGLHFDLSLLGRPKRAEVIVIVTQRRKLLTQLARTYVAVVIDDGDCLAGRAGERPRRRLQKIVMLSSIVRGDGANVRNVFGETRGCIVARA